MSSNAVNLDFAVEEQNAVSIIPAFPYKNVIRHGGETKVAKYVLVRESIMFILHAYSIRQNRKLCKEFISLFSRHLARRLLSEKRV